MTKSEWADQLYPHRPKPPASTRTALRLVAKDVARAALTEKENA